MQLYFGGVSGEELVNNHELTKNDLLAYTPLDSQIEKDKNIEVHYLGYYVKWDPQECFYYATENTGFQANPGRSEGTYSKYASLDDKTDGFHYYMSLIKFGIGRATSDAAHEIREGHITREEGIALVDRYDQEFPEKNFKVFLKYIDIDEDEKSVELNMNIGSDSLEKWISDTQKKVGEKKWPEDDDEGKGQEKYFDKPIIHGKIWKDATTYFKRLGYRVELGD